MSKLPKSVMFVGKISIIDGVKSGTEMIPAQLLFFLILIASLFT